MSCLDAPSSINIEPAMEDENKKHKKTKKKSPDLEGSALVYPRGATPRGWDDAGYTDLMATQAVPEWKVSRSTVPQRALAQLAGSTGFVLSNETHAGDNHGSAPREGASATAELLPNAGDPRPLSARQRRYLNRSRDSQRKKTHAKRPSKKHVKARRLDVKESPLITLRHKYMKPRAMNPSDVSKTTPANTSMTESKAPRVSAFSVSGKALGTDATHFENESYRFVHHTSTTARGEPISANWNFTPNVAASHSHDYSRDRSLNALVASFQTQMRKQGKPIQANNKREA